MRKSGECRETSRCVPGRWQKPNNGDNIFSQEELEDLRDGPDAPVPVRNFVDSFNNEGVLLESVFAQAFVTAAIHLNEELYYDKYNVFLETLEDDESMTVVSFLGEEPLTKDELDKICVLARDIYDQQREQQ